MAAEAAKTGATRAAPATSAEPDVEFQGIGGRMPTVWPLTDRARAWVRDAIETKRPVELAVGIAPEDLAELIASAQDAGLRVETYRLGSEETEALNG
jgi:hypothetical protein